MFDVATVICSSWLDALGTIIAEENAALWSFLPAEPLRRPYRNLYPERPNREPSMTEHVISSIGRAIFGIVMGSLGMFAGAALYLLAHR
ncbi:MAG TPA: hypothetical protein VHQ02_01675 [Usitatibacter sp.]|jgi:hypothetical protein|nr:hypothetical protein [Usitatibacter sp.]